MSLGDKQEMKQWEMVNPKAGVERLEVPGGWLVKHREVVNMKRTGIVGQAGIVPAQINMAICFVPDDEHEWEVSDE